MSQSTCWLLIEGAAAGDREERDAFARHYAPVVRAYLGARWRGTPRLADLDDAVQEFFVECFRDDGVLDRTERDRPGGFRALLYGVARNVARRFEERAMKRRESPPPSEVNVHDIAGDETALSRVFDRAWARQLLREAFDLLEEKARCGDGDMARRVEILRRRFRDGTSIRDLAAEWGVESKPLHHQLERAKGEYRAALAEVVAFHSPGTPGEIERQCEELLALVRAT